LIHAIETTPIAGRSLDDDLRRLLISYASVITANGQRNEVAPDMLTPEILEDIKVRLLFVSPIKPLNLQDSEPEVFYQQSCLATDIQYQLRNNDGSGAGSTALVIPGWIRERTTEVLFQGKDDYNSVITACLESLLKVKSCRQADRQYQAVNYYSDDSRWLLIFDRL